MDLLIFIFIAFIIINIQWNYVEGKSGFGLTPVWGICDAQCEAYCMELENDCEGKCSRNSLANEWVIHCLQPSIDCLVGSCSNFGFQEEGYIPQVPSISATRDHTDAIIKWDTDTVSSYVIYIIQQSWIGDDDWKTMGLSIHPNYTVSVGCRSPFIRVASVSKYGSRFFCNPIKVPDLKIRNVENITASYIYYDNMTDEVKLLLKWDPPLDWNNSNVDSYKWIPRPIIKGCPVLSFYQRQSLKVFFDYGSKLNDLSVLARIPGYAKNCQLTLQVIAILDCSSDYLQAGPTANFTIDCLIIDGYMCPPVPYNPPGNVEHVKVMLIPGQQTPHVRILWSAPTDLGSSKIIAEYWIAWGILDMNPAHTLFGSPQNLLDIQNMTVPGNQLFAEFDLTSNFTDKTMGMQIMACGPGHSVPKNGWVSPVFNIPSTADILRGQLLTSDDGFIIVKIPNIPSVRVYWRLTNNRSNVRSYKFRWGIYRDMVRSWLLQIDEDISPENTTELFMDKRMLTNSNINT